jgi:hypothetical protein
VTVRAYPSKGNTGDPTTDAGRVLTHETLLARVWGREYTDEIDDLKVTISRLLWVTGRIVTA